MLRAQNALLSNLCAAAAIVCGAAVFSACDESLSSLAGPTPNLEPTFSSIQQNIFETTDSAGRTACVTCHTNTGRTPSGGLNLNHDVAYEQLVNRASVEKAASMRVLPGDSESSYLYQKVEGSAGITGRRMPQNGPPYLTDGQILIIKRWIELGAPNN
jgi:hypothetical protein